MGAFNSAIITKKGQALLTKVVQGSIKLEFTHIKTSENKLSGDLASLTNIGTVKQAEKIASIVRQNDYNVKVSTSFSNKGLTTGYYVRNIGLYAMDPQEGEILYSISVADESTATADWMPPFNGANISSLMVDLITAVSSASSVNITVDPTAFATVAQIMEVNEHLTALDNAITTTAEHILKNGVAGVVKINKVLGKSEDTKDVVVSEIKAHGAQAFDISHIHTYISQCTPNEDGYITVVNNSTSNQHPTAVLELYGEHTLSVEVAEIVEGGGTKPSIYILNVEGEYNSGIRDTGYVTKTFNGFAKLVFAVPPNGGAIKCRIMLTAGTKALPYEPYKENHITLSQPITLKSDGDVTDELTSDGVIKRVGVDAEYVEPIPVVDQLALRSLLGYDGATTISTDSEIAPVIEAEYATNKLGAHTLTGLLTAQRNEIKLAGLINP